MEFPYFVTTYYKKQEGHSGRLYDVATVAEFEGVTENEVKPFFDFCDKYPTLNDDQLIALNPVVVVTPFGTKLELPPPVPVVAVKDVGNMAFERLTPDEAWAYWHTKNPDVFK